MNKKLAFLSILLYNLCCFSQTLTLQAEAHKFNIDQSKTLVISQIKDIDTYTNLSAQYSNLELILGALIIKMSAYDN